MTDRRHFPSSISTSFSEAIAVTGSPQKWVFLSGQLGVDIGEETPSTLSFENEVRQCFERLRVSLENCGGLLANIVRLDVYVTDLSEYGIFSKIRGEIFPDNPPTSTAVQVAGLLFGARVEISAVALLTSS